MAKEFLGTLGFSLFVLTAAPAAGQSDYFSPAPSSGIKAADHVVQSLESIKPADDYMVAPHARKPGAGCKGCGKSAYYCDCDDLAALDKAVAGSHKGVFYDNNFDYLCDPYYDQWWPGDRLKRIDLWGWGVLDIGGQYRMRLHNERHHRGLGITGNNDDFLLYRTRLYANLEVGQNFRAYVEMLDAVSNYENLPPRPIEENRTELQNAFGDLKVWDNGCGQLWVRAGRQELLYGSQRTVSPLDWGNTRRTFEGYKVFWKGRDWNVDAFYTRPMRTDVDSLDSPDYDQEFMGIFSTYKGGDNQTVDLYYLRYNNENAPFKFDTFGARLAGSRDRWLWDLEAAYQSGEFGAADHSAGAYTIGFGWKSDCHWKPTVWSFYDWASGSRVPGNGYHHLFPLAHKYLGFMDLFGRRNLTDWNTLVTLSPHKRIRLLFWHHIFHLETIRDTPYNVTMSAFNPGNAPGSTDLGQEIDMVVSWTINPKMNLLFGYSHFFAGDYYATTVGAIDTDADFYYTQFEWNF